MAYGHPDSGLSPTPLCLGECVFCSTRVEVGSEAAVQIDIEPKAELVTEDTRVVPEDDWSDF